MTLSMGLAMNGFDLSGTKDRVQTAFSHIPRPKDIDGWDNGQHERNPFILFVESHDHWSDITDEALDAAPGRVGETFLNRLTREGLIYYTPLILRRILSGKESSFARDELINTFSPPECRAEIAPTSEEQKKEFHEKVNLFSFIQKNVIADAFDYMAFTQMDWAARQAFEGYWHQFATRQPEIWEPWIK